MTTSGIRRIVLAATSALVLAVALPPGARADHVDDPATRATPAEREAFRRHLEWRLSKLPPEERQAIVRRLRAMTPEQRRRFFRELGEATPQERRERFQQWREQEAERRALRENRSRDARPR